MSKLSEIQQRLKAPKGQTNNFGKYKYRSCEDILEAVKPLLDGAYIIIDDELVMVGDRYYVKATVQFTDDTVQPHQKVSVTAYARESETKKGMDPSQITGAASSYARKYALNGLLLIDDTKDADTDKPPQNRSQASSRPKERKLIDGPDPNSPHLHDNDDIPAGMQGEHIDMMTSDQEKQIRSLARQAYGQGKAACLKGLKEVCGKLGPSYGFDTLNKKQASNVIKELQLYLEQDVTGGE